MCGIAGCWYRQQTQSAADLTAVASRMAAALAHRGPDDQGAWVDPDAGVALGHQRLAIIDPSEAGHQPMVSASGRYVITYNGEVYNFPELRQDLSDAGHAFRGHSDTEIVLTAIEAWGLQAALRRFNGMFAFALWDRDEKRLILARDRLGIKPLYYGCSGSTLLFGSELKALCAHPAFQAAIDRSALATFMQLGYIPAPGAIYQGVRKLLPGSIVTLDRHARAGDLPPPETYWSLRRICQEGESPRGSLSDAVVRLEELLGSAVRLRLVSDVPLGALLSGGIDSSLVTALMQEQGQTVRTFTMAFDDPVLDEAPAARALAEHLATEHTEFRASAAEALALAPELAGLYDEPFADASQIPTVLLARQTRSQVTVALSGDGGDEFFCGYPRYLQGLRLWERLQAWPAPLRRLCRGVVGALPLALWDGLISGARLFAPALLKHRRAGDVMPRFRAMLEAQTLAGLYVALRYHWRKPPVLNAMPQPTVYTDASRQAEVREPVRRLMHMDGACYLPDDILTKVDRASMSTGLEVRVPLLDHRVVEFACRLPLEMLLQGQEGKLPLRQMLKTRVPAATLARPKKGFGVPLADWLRGPLRDWAESLLDVSALQQDGLLDVNAVRQRWQQHLAGTHDWKYPLWDVLVFQAWKKGAAVGC